MLSSKQSPRNTKDMAPEPIGLLVKMRKSLGGGKQHRRNSDDLSHATRSRPLSVPQMDTDTAMSYMRESSLEKTGTVRYSSLTTAPNGLTDSAQVTHTCTNGKLPNGVNCKTDENANKQDGGAHQPKKSNSSIFEKQGARPKVRKSSKGEVANLVDVASKGASLDGERCKPQGTPASLPSVEMDQSRLPAHNTDYDSNSKNSGCPTGNATSDVTFDSFQMSKQTVPCSKPALLPPPRDITSKGCAPMNIYIEAEVPPAFQDEVSVKTLENMKELESRNPPSERPVRLVSPAQQLPEELLVSACMPYTQIEDETSEEGNGEPLPADLKYSQSTGALLTEESQAHQADTPPVRPTATPNIYQSQTFPCNQYSNTYFNGDVTTNNEAAVGDGSSESEGTLAKSVSKSVASSVVKDEPQSCSDKKHCCTCTCGNKTYPYMFVQSDRSDKKTSLVLESIPLAMEEELGSPPKARTPHIAMIINSNSMFLDADSPVKQLSQQDLDMIIKWNNFSLVQETKESSKEEEDQKDCTDTTRAFAAMKMSEEEISSPPDKVLPDNLQDVLGAAGGVDSNETSAPRVDRSSKPKGLKKLPDDDDEDDHHKDEEDPPPLPPRMPSTPSSQSDSMRRTMSAFPYMDDDDDDIPTHEFLSDIGLDFDPDTKNKSKSLPRIATQLPSTSPPEMRAMKRVKTVNMRNRFSQMFKPGSKKKRHSTHGFPDRPLPDIPPHPKLNKIKETAARRLSSYAMTNSDETATAQQASKDGLSKDEVSKLEVDMARKQFAVSLRKISEYGWYWGPMNWDDAEARLENMPDGSFLVRDSSDDRHLLSLSFRAQGSTHHTRVEHQMGKFSFWSQPCSHGSASIVEFVEEAMRHSRSGRVLYFLRPRNPGFPPAAVQLLYPISRFQKARSMQHMCRFVIRKHVRLDHIDSLPLPKRLKSYLKEAQYYTQDDILH
ncbi:uncharacterized protein [Asterias amurensis]|uniref:uncharacterized protein n=1 Tax=Asterias amurensis TaxID=7602 RepID=UPI003AB22E01